MDVEARLLLYTVALGAATGLGHLAWRRAYEFRTYMAELAALLAVSVAALLVPGWTRLFAWPAFWAFVVVAVAPSALIEAARRAARLRRYGLAWTTSTTAAALIGMPTPLRREAALYGALAAAERGDETRCRRRLERVARSVGIPEELGGEALVRVLPAAARRRWDDVLAALPQDRRRPPQLLAVEVRAAAETGDLRRAFRACREIDAFGESAGAARSTARRSLLAAAGRADFLAEAARRRMPIVAGPPGTGELAVARAREALGDEASAAAGYAAARRVGRGGVRIDADAGASRCAERRPVVAAVDGLEAALLLDLEAACRAETSAPDEIPLVRRAPFTLGVCVATAVASALVFLALGFDSVSLLAAGALSAPLIRAEHEWWRLGTTMLLHGGWFHLGMNLSAIVFIGVPLESRVGAARTAVVYLGAGFLASMASVFCNDTPVGVGASGAAMGLVGALAALVVARRNLFGDAERRRWLGALGLTVIATLAVGLAESDAIDNAAHVAGFVAGAVIGLLVLPRDAEGAAFPALRRLAAAVLVAATVACVAETAARMPAWRGTQVVETAGARATLPSFLRVRRTADAEVVASRTPLDFVVEIGAAPARPRPELLAPESEKSRRDFERLLAAGPTKRGGIRDDAGATVESSDYADPDGSGFRLVEFRRGDAFALAVVWLAEGGESEDDALAVRIGRSLTPTE